MAALDNNNNLPQVLILKLPPAFALFGDQFFSSEKFQFLKAYESDLPLHQFLTTHAQSVQAILSSGAAVVTADILRLVPSVRLVVATHIGLDNIDLAECCRRGIAVTNAGNVGSEDVADTAVGLLIDVLRKISSADGFVRQGLWPLKGDYPLAFKVSGKRIGIVGLGKIGSGIAKRLEQFSCIISYNSRNKNPSVPYIFYSDLCELAANSDALIICCALTAQTHHLINKQVLSSLGKEGVVVNISRGSVIDEQELVRCLMEGEIRGAGLDVFANEPDVPEELFGLDNVVLSPHSATFTVESFKDLQQLVVGNLDAYFSNKPLLSVVALD
ncbi:hypothetical protein LWI28_025476 [Acer negundo]|uniref:Glyoxylate/hydroxypyruvate reductase HPR3-like n=1 Tax=Acer negundo TaxID=4023 RepID=A0AAD5J2I8_ACENE|nr:hypothetical protein LWI28_025476 [Acer negundo]